ncbi:MAG: CHAT domain-containing protein [Candidatus Accumulibacter sp.]|nr:CHAT domain-containing protein [Accumulibacter sp.]
MPSNPQFQGPATGNILVQGGQYGISATGDHNINYQIIVATEEQAQALLAELKEGRRKIEQIPGAVPLPTLILDISPVADRAPPVWRVVTRQPAADPAAEPPAPSEAVDIASPRSADFDRQLARFHAQAATALARAEQRAGLEALAVSLGDALAAVIPAAARQLLVDRGRAEGPPPFLVIESADDRVLSLPWELLRLAGEWSVRDGRLDVARCVPNPHAARLQPPSAAVSVYVNVCAPEGGGLPALSHETEAYRISRALQDHPGVRVNEMGELDDLLKVLCAPEPPTVIHFSGHGGQGQLHFEDEFGGDRCVRVEDIISRSRSSASGVQRWPRLFYLSCGHGQTPAQEGSTAGVSSTAARLHAEGIPQVIAHFGPVYDRQATDAEAAFYTARAAGRRTREALRAARTALAAPFTARPREAQRRDDAAPDTDGQLPFAWALLVLYHAGDDQALGLLVPRGSEADINRAEIRRRDEALHAGGRTRVLRAGFIGRRRELHTLRRRLRDGQNTLVVQGLGGLGKSVYCWKALALYGERGYLSLPLWCAAVEDEPDPAEALVHQFTTAIRPLAGAQWDELVENALRQIPEPAARLAALLNRLVGQEQAPPIAVYLDNLESLMRRPDHEDDHPATPGEWRTAGCRAVWTAFAELAAQHPRRLAVLASCRYRHPDFPRVDLMPFLPMADDTIFRLLEWFPALGRLSHWTRDRLVPLLQGHPRALEFLEGFVLAEQRRWENDEGPLPAVPDEDASEQEWQRFVSPVLAATQQKLREDLLFDALWQKVLRPADRRLLLRLTVLRRPAERELALALADPDAGGADLQRLRDAGLLEEEIERNPQGDELTRRFAVHAVVAGFARTLAGGEGDTWRREGCRLAGDFLDARLRAAQQRDAVDALDAGHYLFDAGEVDRGTVWLLTLGEWQTGRGLIAQALSTLTPLQREDARRALGRQNQVRTSGVLADCLAGLGQLEPAAAELRRAVALGQELAAADPSNAEWQRDLSLSLAKLGDVELAQGDLAGAQARFEDSRTISARLAAADPSNEI